MDLVTPGFGMIFWIIIIGFALILPIIALISVLSNQFPNNEKLIWVLVIIFAPLMGALIYFMTGKLRQQPN